MTPEQLARKQIDQMLAQSGWDVQDLARMNIFAQLGVAIREFPLTPINEDISNGSNGHLSVTLRLPKSVHAALLAEAAAEGVSMDQLCLSKLVAQLRELV